jgi:hypothetical protein
MYYELQNQIFIIIIMFLQNNYIHVLFSTGVRAFRIPPLNPLMLDEVRINEGSGPVSINLKLNKLHVRGGEQYKIKSVK